MSHDEFFAGLYAAFNARDIERALAGMHADVDWPNGMEGGRELGQEAVREYWKRQFAQIDSHVEPVAVAELSDGRVSVEVHQVVRSLQGELLSDRRVTHVYTLRDELVTRMDIVDQAA